MPNALKIEDLPHRRMEAWKWTDLRARIEENASGLSQVGLPKLSLPDGVSVTEEDSTDAVSATPMSALARNVAPKVWTITVPDGFSSQTLLTIEGLEKGHIRLRLNIGKGAKLSLVEHHQGTGGFCNIDMAIKMGEGAALERVIVHDDAADHVRVATTHFTLWKNAKVKQYGLSFGGATARLETRLAAMGTGVEAVLNGAYLLDGKRHTDMTSYIDLAAPDGVIRQAVKGVVSDKARGVFQGKFHVRRPAQKTDAEMRHDALMLSDTAQIRAKPELEIYADDVECAHGNTLGALYEDALFYMRQRGISLAQAKALLTEAFVAGVFDEMSDEALQESLLGKVREWLGA